MLSLIKKTGLPRDSNRAKPLFILRAGFPAKTYFWLGVGLLAAWLAQQSTGWRWAGLAELQAGNAYMQISGFALLALILYQWRFSLRRARGDLRQAAWLLHRHKLAGVLAPLFFFGHSQAVGYGYLQILSLSFLLVFLTGLCNFEIVPLRKPWYRPAWICVHVSLSMALLILASYHVYLSYAYK